jgi:hypothetical protein
MQHRRTKTFLLALAVFALMAFAGTAIAATPLPGGVYGACKGDRCMTTLKVSANGKKIQSFSSYTKCNSVPFRKPLSLSVSGAGVFAYNGTLTDVLGNKIDVVITGKFVTAKKASGTLRYSTATCDSKVIKYSAVFGKGIG